MSGGILNSWSLSLYYRGVRLKEFLVSPVAAISGAKSVTQILRVKLPIFQENRGFTGETIPTKGKSLASKKQRKRGWLNAIIL